MRIPYGAFEPYVLVGAGFAHLGGARTDDDQRVSKVGGFALRVGGGLDYYMSRTFSLGALVSFDYLGLKRAKDTSLCSGQASCAFSSRGSSFGFAISPSLVVGLHF